MGGFWVERFAVIGMSGEDEVVLGLVEGLDGEAGGGEPAGLADEGFEDGDLALVVVVAEGDFFGNERAFLGGRDETASARGWPMR